MSSSPQRSARRGRLQAVPGVGGEAALVTRTHHGGGSLASRALTLGMRATVRPVISTWAMTSRLPWPYFLADQPGRLLRKVDGTRVEQLDLPECAAHVVSNEHTDKGRVIVYFQGGAFLVGGIHLHGQLISRIAQRTGATVVVPRFRKLPRHPISAAISDGLDAYRHALDHGVAPEDIAFAGDSAGGFLTFMVALAAREAGLPVPGALAAMSPLIDLDPARRELRRGGCALFGPRAFHALATLAERAHVRGLAEGLATASPSEGMLEGLPPSLIQVSSAECLYADAERMASLLARSRVATELQVWDHQVHVFQAAAGLIPEADQAIAELTGFIDRTVPGSLARAVRSHAVG